MDVIVNADDFGMNHNVNLAIDYCFKKNIISSTTFINTTVFFFGVREKKKQLERNLLLK